MAEEVNTTTITAEGGSEATSAYFCNFNNIANRYVHIVHHNVFFNFVIVVQLTVYVTFSCIFVIVAAHNADAFAIEFYNLVED